MRLPSQAASLATLLILARGFTQPLTDNAANNGLKQMLKTAAVDRRRNRVLLTATVPVSMFTSLQFEREFSRAD